MQLPYPKCGLFQQVPSSAFRPADNFVLLLVWRLLNSEVQPVRLTCQVDFRTQLPRPVTNVMTNEANGIRSEANLVGNLQRFTALLAALLLPAQVWGIGFRIPNQDPMAIGRGNAF